MLLVAPLTYSPYNALQVAEASSAETSCTAVEALREELECLQRRLRAVETHAADSRPLDSMTVGAVEARLCVLEEDYVERQRHVDDTQEAQVSCWLARLC